MATLTKSSLGSTCMVFGVFYVTKVCISELLSLDPFLLCHVGMISLGRLSTLCNPCIICHFLLNANMHTPTANTHPLYISLMVCLTLSTCATVINAPTMFYDILYNFSKEDALERFFLFNVESLI